MYANLRSCMSNYKRFPASATTFLDQTLVLKADFLLINESQKSFRGDLDS